MKVFNFDPGSIHLLSLSQGDDLLDSLTSFARSNGILAATITFLGSVSRADLSWYDPDTGDYRTFVREEQLEVAGGTGNISLYEGQPLVHIHAVFADSTGQDGRRPHQLGDHRVRHGGHRPAAGGRSAGVLGNPCEPVPVSEPDAMPGCTGRASPQPIRDQQPACEVDR